jgi:O-acetyl-ADP-ribose deacetylase (regulator of RNase III)
VFTIKDGDLLYATEPYICHQCNCTSVGNAAGIARVIFDTFPFADIYKDRDGIDTPGTIAVAKTPGGAAPSVVNILGQFYPGGLAYENSSIDGRQARRKYFKLALWEMAKTLKGRSFAFPWRIGCGIAGGDWGDYLGILKSFESYIDGDVTIYRLPGDKS